MVGTFRRAPRRAGHICRRLVPVAAALVVPGVLCSAAVAQAAPGAATASPTIVVSGDSLLATSLPSFGQTTATVTRPDAVTGQPVVIGTFTGFANPFTPFSVNTETPTAGNPSGDCWQKGALSVALTPDVQPGDTVSVAQAGLLGSSSTSDSYVVQPSDVANATPGPISGCSSIAAWARNAITSAPSSVAGGADLTVSGVAQPLATAVSVSATDGSKTTDPVTATPAADGSWSATIPAGQLANLSGSKLTVTPVMAVPDVSTGAQAHIAGVGVGVDLALASAATTPSTAAASSTKSTSPAQSAHSTAPAAKHVSARVTAVRAAARISLAGARRQGIRVSFVVPRGAHVVQVQLMRGRTRLYTAVRSSQRPGARQTVTIPAALAKRLRAGSYTLAIKAGASRSTLGPASTHALRITRP